MARRLHQTLADYVVIAISPALIMALVGSLVFFLLRVFYQGEFQERLYWVMACFVFASVLIGRISIEEGLERAMPFGAALALLVGIAANRFMEYQGTWIDNFGWIINFGLIGLVWWCAHQLTWDCTVIDDSEDASGEGLMQTAGLERPPDERDAEDNTKVDRLEGTTSREVPAGFWQRYVEHQRRPHAPGVWVVYFSLAALPLFGLGQWLIPTTDLSGRRAAFWLLTVYVAAGMGLLLTTSFLGLRRYLRQRRIEMPTLMANLWLGMGGLLIAALLAVASLLPRPSPEYAISELPFTLGSPKQDSSKIAPVKSDGTKDEDPQSVADRQPEGSEPENPDELKGSGNEPTPDPQQGEGSSSGDAQSSQGEQGGKAKSSQQQNAQQQNSQPQNSRSQNLEQQGGEQESPEPSESKQAGESDSSKPSKSKSSDSDKTESGDQKSGQSKGASKTEKSDEPSLKKSIQDYYKRQEELAKPQSTKKSPQEQVKEGEFQRNQPPEGAPPESTPPTEGINAPLSLLKYVFYALFALLVLYLLWTYWQDVLAAIRNFINELRTWWAEFWGGKRRAGELLDEKLELSLPPTPFASFADPFLSGEAERISLAELVRYSYEAFEAWSREHGVRRQPDQTPHELAREVGKRNGFIASESRALAEIYSRAAFARDSLPAASSEQLRQLWQVMQLHSVVPVGPPHDDTTLWA